MKRSVKLVVGVAFVVMALIGAFMLAMRTKFRPVQDAVRRMNREVMNPQQMETAGQPGAYASVMRHVGRKTGTAYETPVLAMPTEDGFVIGLPYGTRAEWLRNVLAAGSATLVHEGATYDVDRPDLVSGTVAEPYFEPKEQRTHRLFKVDEFLRLRKATAAESEEPLAESA